jgi:ATP-grasp domain
VTGYLVDYMDAYALLKRHGIAVVHSAYVTSPEDALAFYQGPILQYHPSPLTLKAVSPRALDKSAKGLVLVGLAGDAEVCRGFTELASAARPYVPFKILAQPTVKGRHMGLAVGSQTHRDGQRWLFLGLLPHGGQEISELVERPIPVSPDSAAAMIAQLHSAHALAPRGRDLAMLKHFLTNVSKVVEDNHIVELQLSPVILHENQYTAVDIKMFADRAKLPTRKRVPSKKATGDRSQTSLERRTR